MFICFLADNIYNKCLKKEACVAKYPLLVLQADQTRRFCFLM